MTRQIGSIVTCISAALLVACSNQPTPLKNPSFADLSGPYCGLPVPDSEPEILLPGLVSTYDSEGCSTFLDEGSLLVFASRQRGVLFTHMKSDGGWSTPVPAPWQNESGITDFTAGPDGRTVYFQSSRPISATASERETNIWAASWSGSAWSDPTPLPPPLNLEDRRELYPTAAADGTLCFFSGMFSGTRAGEIYCGSRTDGAYGAAELLPPPLNTAYHEVDPVISPDGSYLLFGSGRPGGYGLADLYLSFRRYDGSWSRPLNAGETLNRIAVPVRMTLTSDGRYLLFLSQMQSQADKGEPVDSANTARHGDSDVYWVNTRFVDELRSTSLRRHSAVDAFREEYDKRDLAAAIAALERAIADEDHYLELSELLMFCGELIADGAAQEAADLVNALQGVLDEPFRIQQGYATACILNGLPESGVDELGRLWQEHPDSRSELQASWLTYQLSRKSRPHDEVALHRFVVDQFPESDKAWTELAAAYHRVGDVSHSIDACNSALALNPKNERAIELLEKLE